MGKFLTICLSCFVVALTILLGLSMVRLHNPSDSDHPLTAAAAQAERTQIEGILHTQAAAWNRGDIDAFMEGYARTSNLRFASGSTITRGWTETLERYRQRYPDRAAMGTLTFSDLDTSVFSRDAAVVFGRWHLKTDHGEPNGLFTLIFRRTDFGGWFIVADHTSAADH